jgi:hypothetical protein
VRVQIAAVVIGRVKDNARPMLDWTDGVDFLAFHVGKARRRHAVACDGLVAWSQWR